MLIKRKKCQNLPSWCKYYPRKSGIIRTTDSRTSSMVFYGYLGQIQSSFSLFCLINLSAVASRAALTSLFLSSSCALSSMRFCRVDFFSLASLQLIVVFRLQEKLYDVCEMFCFYFRSVFSFGAQIHILFIFARGFIYY